MDSIRYPFSEDLRLFIKTRIDHDPNNRGSALNMRDKSVKEIKKNYDGSNLFLERDLMAAIDREDVAEVQILCSKFESEKKGINIADGVKGQSPSHKAVEKGNQEIVGKLLQAGADVAAIDKVGETPFHAVAATGHTGIAQQLLDKASDHSVADYRKWKPVHIAVTSDQLEMVRLLCRFNEEVKARAGVKHWSVLHIAAWSGNTRMLEYLIGQTAKVDLKNKSNKTPLYSASKYGKAEIAQVLLNRGADPNTCSSKSSMTPLHVALKYGRHDVIKKLRNHRKANFLLTTKSGVR